MIKNSDIHLRVDEKLKEKIKSQSKKANMTMSEYINRVLKNKNIVVIEDGKEIYYELNKIGNNVNQIARKLNSGIATRNDIKSLDNISKELNKIWQLLNLLMSK